MAVLCWRSCVVAVPILAVRTKPVYRTTGVLFIAEAAAEVMLFDSTGWRVVAHWLAAPFLP